MRKSGILCRLNVSSLEEDEEDSAGVEGEVDLG